MSIGLPWKLRWFFLSPKHTLSTSHFAKAFLTFTHLHLLRTLSTFLFKFKKAIYVRICTHPSDRNYQTDWPLSGGLSRCWSIWRKQQVFALIGNKAMGIWTCTFFYFIQFLFCYMGAVRIFSHAHTACVGGWLRSKEITRRLNVSILCLKIKIAPHVKSRLHGI